MPLGTVSIPVQALLWSPTRDHSQNPSRRKQSASKSKMHRFDVAMYWTAPTHLPPMSSSFVKPSHHDEFKRFKLTLEFKLFTSWQSWNLMHLPRWCTWQRAKDWSLFSRVPGRRNTFQNSTHLQKDTVRYSTVPYALFPKVREHHLRKKKKIQICFHVKTWTTKD